MNERDNLHHIAKSQEFHGERREQLAGAEETIKELRATLRSEFAYFEFAADSRNNSIRIMYRGCN